MLSAALLLLAGAVGYLFVTVRRLERLLASPAGGEARIIAAARKLRDARKPWPTASPIDEAFEKHVQGLRQQK